MVSRPNVDAHDLTKENFSYLYNHDPVKIDYQIAKQDSLYKLILTFHLVKVLPSDKLDGFELYEQKKINSGQETLIQPIAVKVDSGFIKNVIELDFSASDENNYLVVKFSFLEKPYLYGIPINESLGFPLSNIIYGGDNEAMFYNGYKKSDSVWFEDIDDNTEGEQFYAYLYKEDFPAAIPPMVVDGVASGEMLQIKKRIAFRRGMMLNEADYLYFVQNDTVSDKGVSILSHKEYYPRNKKTGELIEALMYICTGDEYEELNNADDQKLAFNNFWLSHIDDKKLASETIKKYFRAVKFANALFTDYKNGWKTDRGMIYIAFGPPEVVTKKEEIEIWEYKTYDGDIKFTFAKTRNLFVQYHYSLIREKSLNKAWFTAVQKWRTGDL
ncbi:GWxTD domain-containing protein [Reichenbachiella faecimaris]|uniref:GWxTD domain-containing protein n=1 Tax=Reichenbachiella faecimaris TaxID=692418 RepID=A0A1W2GCQ5_REIFA|nr:GWxTD domain-containing protein [Reichenbachiella faecimaris]SMD34413.1 GWxTD domain-containing protein [Reichenbachiella faecimaris]